MTSLTGSDELLTDACCQTDEAIQVTTPTVMWSVTQVQNQWSSFANELQWASKGRTCSANWPVVQTEANNDKDVSIDYNSSIYPLTPVATLSWQRFQNLLCNFYPGRPTIDKSAWLKWSAQFWGDSTWTHENTPYAEQNRMSLRLMKDKSGGASVRFEGENGKQRVHLWPSASMWDFKST